MRSQAGELQWCACVRASAFIACVGANRLAEFVLHMMALHPVPPNE